jgi:hypothetical protein
MNFCQPHVEVNEGKSGEKLHVYVEYKRRQFNGRRNLRLTTRKTTEVNMCSLQPAAIMPHSAEIVEPTLRLINMEPTLERVESFAEDSPV